LQPLTRGLVVQLVRIPACHAGGREFESRPDRNFDKLSHRIEIMLKNDVVLWHLNVLRGLEIDR
jgi:hypothetical protein